MGKNPAFQFYPNDWLSDPQLQMTSPSTRGIWINLLCYMWWSPAKGSVTGTVEDLCRLGRCSAEEMARFLDENSRYHFANVTNAHSDVTLSNRRMMREEKVKESARCRKSCQRERDSHTEVTPPSPSPSTPSPSPTTEHVLGKDVSAEPRNGTGSAAATVPIPENLRGWLLGTQHLTSLADARHGAYWQALERAYDAYPWLYFEEELRRADAWIAANPRKKPTERGLPRFLRSWMERAVDIGRRRQHAER